jgi:hypothetical protein
LQTVNVLTLVTVYANDMHALEVLRGEEGEMGQGEGGLEEGEGQGGLEEANGERRTGTRGKGFTGMGPEGRGERVEGES